VSAFWTTFRLAGLLALRSLGHHRMVAVATILGVAIGILVVSAVLIVDNNTRIIVGKSDATGATIRKSETEDTTASRTGLRVPSSRYSPRESRISFERAGQPGAQSSQIVPTQKGKGTTDAIGTEDYAAMRLAVRLASLLSFLVGAVIVFYTMRFSVAARAREFCLLLCLGESRAGVALSLTVEAMILGVLGTVFGLLVSVPAGTALLGLGISTTGQAPAGTVAIPWGELAAMGMISVTIALMGVAGPIRVLYRMEIAQVLQPRFLAENLPTSTKTGLEFAWLLPPVLIAAYVLSRPSLISWLSVVHFFLIEAAFVVVLAAVTLWWVTPLLRGVIRLFEQVIKPFLPLEALLTGRRMRLGSRQVAFAVTGIVLVFGMLTALHDITRSLKDEIVQWSNAAMVPYMFYERTSMPFDETIFNRKLAAKGLIFVRMSAKLAGPLPLRIVHGDDVNPYRQLAGRPLLVPGTVIVSKTLAARHNVKTGDVLRLSNRDGNHRFHIIEITDDIGYYAEDGRYIDMKSYLVFSHANPIFANNLERTLGDYGSARYADGSLPYWRRLRHDALYPYYLRTNSGPARGYWQRKEIDRDFRIFDFILAMTVLLAAIGVANTLLIQVHARGREFSVLRTIGMDRWQITKMLLAEGLIIGFVSAFLAAIVGNALGAISVSFLDHFTLFDYRFILSAKYTLFFSGLCIFVSCVAAIYPAIVANRMSSAESLHYE
jgi:putative ABC transport system permease protein